jgi:hypothetical protein
MFQVLLEMMEHTLAEVTTDDYLEHNGCSVSVGEYADPMLFHNGRRFSVFHFSTSFRSRKYWSSIRFAGDTPKDTQEKRAEAKAPLLGPREDKLAERGGHRHAARAIRSA